MYNPFKPPKEPNGFNPIHEQRAMDMLKRSVAPNSGPLTIPPTTPAPHVGASISPQFQKLKAMFAKNR